MLHLIYPSESREKAYLRIMTNDTNTNARKEKNHDANSYFSHAFVHWCYTPRFSRGYFVILVLVFSTVFFTLVSTLAGYIFVEKRAQLARENREKALHVAEAGLEYYRWHLAHWPDDLEDGTGNAGPYVHTVPDPEGGMLGTFSLAINGSVFCGSVASITIVSTGWSADDPNYKRVLDAQYTRPSVAEYSHIVNANVWAGGDRVINGPYHSNGGVRMDGTHNADVTSSVETWQCTPSFGCNPTTTKNGVFGVGSQPALWNYPTPSMNFAGITTDLTKLKAYATTSGRYVAPSGNYGYKVVFKSDGTIDVRTVTGTTQIWGYSTENGWQQERTIIATTGSLTNYTIPASCPVVFVEDNVWLEGVVNGKVTFVAADVTQQNVSRSIIIPNSITYANATSGLAAIAEENALISLQSPNVMSINGIFIAQNGRFSRNHYVKSGTHGLPSSLDPYVLRSTLNTNGTVVSNGRVGTKWSCGGTYCSGYSQRNDSFDNTLAKDPPPFTPSTSDDYKFVEWREQ